MAWKIAREYCIDTPQSVPVEDIAMDRGVLCLEAPLRGCLARLVRKGDRGIIRTRTGIPEEGRKRFAIAHELGHWFLHVSESQMFICTSEQMRDYKGSPLEVEANLFASELLMPSNVFRPLAENAAPCLKTISDLAAIFNTSLTSTAMKFVDQNRHESVLVLSRDRQVLWSKQNGNRSGLRINKGQTIHQDSLAWQVVEPVGKLGPITVDPELWISENWYQRSIEMTEESWTLDGYNSVLTLLAINDSDEITEQTMIDHLAAKRQRATLI